MTRNPYDIRRQAIVTLEHAIARIGFWDAQGWLATDDDTREAVFTLQQAKWSLEAMDSPASFNKRFWTEERQKYDAMLGARA